MEELNVKIERTKYYLHSELKNWGLLKYYRDSIVNDYFDNPLNSFCNPYQIALNLFDDIIQGKAA